MAHGCSSGNDGGFAVRRMTSVDALAYDSMFFAKLRRELLRMNDGDPLFGFVIEPDGVPAGAVIARFGTADRQGEVAIESLFVKPEYRGLGLAQALLRAVETHACLNDKSSELSLIYLADRPTTRALEGAMARVGWNLPEGDMILCHAQGNLVGWDLYNGNHGFSPEFVLFPWSELTEEDRVWIERTQAASAWIPADLYPLQFSDCEPLNSLGIRYRGNVVGWVLTHRVATDAIRYTCSFMHPDFQRQLRIFPAYREAFRLQREAGIPGLIFLVPYKHRGMLRWVLRWPKEFCEVKESRRCSKRLYRANTSCSVKSALDVAAAIMPDDQTGKKMSFTYA